MNLKKLKGCLLNTKNLRDTTLNLLSVNYLLSINRFISL